MLHVEEKSTLTVKPDCPYCGFHTVIRYGHKYQKQRFYCKSCGKTFVPNAHTIMPNSCFPTKAWRKVISGMVHGNAIDYTKKDWLFPLYGLRYEAQGAYGFAVVP